MKFNQNLRDLIVDSHRYQYVGISDAKAMERKQPKLRICKWLFFFSKAQWIIIGISIVISLFIPKGISSDFAGYIVSGLSLFVGIFFTFIITLYDKFKNIDFSKYDKKISEEKHYIGIRLKNFFKKVTVLSLYSIILSIICIILLSITLLFGEYINNCQCSIMFVCDFLKIGDYWCVVKYVLAKLYGTIVFYFLFDFLLIAVYLISSIYDFIISEYNQIKLS